MHVHDRRRWLGDRPRLLFDDCARRWAVRRLERRGQRELPVGKTPMAKRWQIEGVTLVPGESEDKLRTRAAEQLGLAASALTSFAIIRRSLDARKKGQPLF